MDSEETNRSVIKLTSSTFKILSTELVTHSGVVWYGDGINKLVILWSEISWDKLSHYIHEEIMYIIIIV